MVYDLILRSISSHVSNPNPSKALVLSLHGSTGTGMLNINLIVEFLLIFHQGKNFVAKHIVESLYREGYKSSYVQLYVVSRDFMHNNPEHIIQYKV